jgi:hypothetical protein
MKEEMIHNRLVVGIRDSALSQKLQIDPGLSLESAKRTVRQQEAVQEHNHILREGDSRNNPMTVDGVQTRRQPFVVPDDIKNYHPPPRRRAPRRKANRRRVRAVAEGLTSETSVQLKMPNVTSVRRRKDTSLLNALLRQKY